MGKTEKFGEKTKNADVFLFYYIIKIIIII